MPDIPERGSGGMRPKGRTFSFHLSFGKKPPASDPSIEEISRAAADVDSLGEGAAQSHDSTGAATDAHSFKIEFADGKLRVDEGGAIPYEDPSVAQGEDPKAAREREMWDRLHLIAEGKGAYPDTQRWHSWLSMVTWVIAISLPVAALILAVATGQDQQTVFVVTFGALIIAAMFRSSIR